MLPSLILLSFWPSPTTYQHTYPQGMWTIAKSLMGRHLELKYSPGHLFQSIKIARCLKKTLISNYFTRLNTKSQTPCPKRMPRASNLVSGRYSGVGA